MVSHQELNDHVEQVRKACQDDYEKKMNIMKQDYDLQVLNLRNELDKHWNLLQNNLKQELDKKKDFAKSLTNKKSFGSLTKYSGKHDEYDDWKFQVGSFLSEDPGYHELLIELEKLLKCPTKEDMANIFMTINEKVIEDLDMREMNKQLYQLLSQNCKDKALATVKNLFNLEDVNGFVAWWKLGYEQNAMTAQRMQAITNRVLSPKRCRKYGDVSSALEDWEYALSVYEKVEGNPLSEQARIFSIKRLVPEELETDVNRATNLDTFVKVKAYIVEQVLVRRDVRNSNTGPVGMEVDMMTKMIASLEEQNGVDVGNIDKEYDEKDEFQEECRECNDGSPEGMMNKLFSMIRNKGKGKGKATAAKFDGYCNKCSKYGHMARDCWSSQDKGKGKGKNKGQYNNNYGGKGGKGKSAYGLMWNVSGGATGAAPKEIKTAWTMSLAKIPAAPGLDVKPKKQNMWDILTCSDLRNEESMNDSMDDHFPDIHVKTYPEKKVNMPPMKNYSKNSVRKNLSLNIFQKIPGEKTLNPMVGTMDDGWLKIVGVMDSGASESVAPPSMAPQYPVTPSQGSLVGQQYMAANAGGDPIDNLGEKVLDIVMEDGRESTIKYQVADVHRPLNSISEICDAGGDYGQVVVFGRAGGAILNLETGVQTPFNREDGVYTMGVWVKPKGFTRQGW